MTIQEAIAQGIVTQEQIDACLERLPNPRQYDRNDVLMPVMKPLRANERLFSMATERVWRLRFTKEWWRNGDSPHAFPKWRAVEVY